MSSLPLTSVLCVGTDPTATDVLAAAARRVSAPADVRVFPRLADVPTAGPADSVELLVLGNPDLATFHDARAARDPSALPRWPVLVLGVLPELDGDETIVVPPDEWVPATLARAIRAALALHGCRREHARLCGDLATFGSRIAHDLRTPLGGVMTTTEMLHEVLMDTDPSTAGLTQPIVDSADGMVKLIERMSFLAKAISSREPPQPVDMGTPFWNAFQQLESRLLGANAQLTYPKTWPTVLGHPAWLQLVWRELISNAVQHGARGGAITAAWTEADGGFRFSLCDRGRIPAAKQALLFMPFHRLNEPGAPRGLGLAIVHRLVEAEGGSCGFTPTPEGESCFHFTLPAAPSNPAVEPHAVPAG